MSDQPTWIPDLEIEDAQIKWAWSNFEGRVEAYNAEGKRSFTIVLPEDRVDELREQGWNVKEIEGREEGDPSEFHLKVQISFAKVPPRVYLIKSGNRKMRIDERDLSDINRATCNRVDVIIAPSRWADPNNPSRHGVSAYVKELYASVTESRFAEQYADFEEI